MKKSLSVLTLTALLLPGAAAAFEVSAWIPYWRTELGVQSILPQLDKFTEVNPFVYTVRQDGTLYLNSPLDSEPWVSLRAKAKELNVRYIPTVMWANADAMDEIFRDPGKRAEHIRGIVQEIYARDFDGIDIDYEAKYARTKDYFSLFLKELQQAAGYDKWIMCTIEARTPLDSRYSSPESIPADIEYANDFKEINKYCDRVRIMAYDQGRFDLKLNKEKAHPYAPVADTDWVEKVMRLTAEDIDKEKLAIGVATYGYEYDTFAFQGSNVVAAASAAFPSDVQYSRLWSFNPGYAMETAQKLGLTPERNSAGELSLIYPASQAVGSAIPLPTATRLMTWSDAGAVGGKIGLAKELGVQGISIFKIDGGQDPALWDVLTGYTLNRTSAKKQPGSTPIAETVGTGTEVGTGTVAVVAPVPTRDLKTGATGEDVRALQLLLNARGFTLASSGPGSPGNETARFGALTRAALIRFQKAHAITPAVGYFGPITRAKFKALE